MNIIEKNDKRVSDLEELLKMAGLNINDEPRAPLAEWSSDGPRLWATKLGILIADIIAENAELKGRMPNDKLTGAGMAPKRGTSDVE